MVDVNTTNPGQLKEDNPSQYFHWSKSIEQPKFPSSTAAAVEGATTAIEKGSEGLAKFAKDSVEDITDSAISKEQDKRVGVVENVYSNLLGKNPTATDSLVSNTKPLPEDLQQGFEFLKKTKDSYDQGGMPRHLRETAYDAAIYGTAQRLRNIFPDFKKEIDEKVKEVSGRSPTANEYLKDMLADLNEAYGKKDQTKQKIDSKFLENIDQGHPELVASRRNWIDGKKTDDEALYDIAKVTGYRSELKQLDLQSRRMEAGDKFGKQLAETKMNTIGPPLTRQTIQGVLDQFGLTSERMQRIHEGKEEFPKDVAIPLSNALALAKSQASTLIDRELADKFNDDKSRQRGGRTDMGTDYEPRKKAAMDEFTLWDDFLNHPDHGMGHIYKRLAEAEENKTKWKILASNEEAAQPFKKYLILKDFGIQNLGMADMQTIGMPNWKGVMDLLSHSASDPSVRPKGARTMGESLDTISDNNPKDTAVAATTASTHINQIIRGLTQGNLDNNEKANVVDYIFGKDSKGWVGKIQDDYYDPATMRNVSGKHALFLQLSQPGMVHSIEDLSKQNGDVKILDRYREFMRTAFKEDVIGPDLDKAVHMQNVRGMQLKFHSDPTGSKQPFFEIVRGGNNSPYYNPMLTGHEVYGMDGYTPDRVETAIYNLNKGLQAYHNVFGPQTESEFLGLMHKFGMNLKDAQVSHTPGEETLYRTLLLSIGASKGPIENSDKNAKRFQNPYEQLNPQGIEASDKLRTSLTPTPVKTERPSAEDINIRMREFEDTIFNSNLPQTVRDKAEKDRAKLFEQRKKILGQ